MLNSHLPFLQTYTAYFSPLSEAAWQAFGELFSTQHLHKNEYFARAGRVEGNIGFLLEGTIRSFYRNEKGNEYNKTFHVPHCFVGAYSSLTSGQPNQIYIQALTDCCILAADYRKIVALYDLFPDLERFARRLAESYFAAKEKREIELVLMDAAERYKLFQKEFPEAEHRIAQYHIASYLGITPTQLSRIRAKKV